MVKARIIETNEGIQDEITVETFDSFARIMRDKGWLNVDSLLESGLEGGRALEIGPGPGYVGLEWLGKQNTGASLTGLEISPAMINTARKNAKEYGLDGRTKYVQGNAMEMPFPDNSFDSAFSNGSLHEWEDPARVFGEILRVLKPGGRFCVCDLRRDASPLKKWMIYAMTSPREIRPGFLTSFNAAYTMDEITEILDRAGLDGYTARREFFGMRITGEKAGAAYSLLNRSPEKGIP